MPNSRLIPSRGQILVGGLALAMLLPIVVTPFLGDDIFNSYVNGTIGYGHTTFWQFISDLNMMWIRNGRFFPGAFIESYGLFHIMPSLQAYKVFQLVITLANVATFFLLLRFLRLPSSISLFGTIVLLCTFQMREYHDGLLGFSGNIEFITELTLLSLLGLLVYLRSGRPWPLVISSALYAIGLLTYEVTYFFWLAFLAVAFVERPWQPALKAIAPYFALSAFVVGIQLFVKATAHTQADADYNVRLNAAAFAFTFLKQALAAIPLSYVIADPSSLYNHGAAVFALAPIWVVAAIFGLVGTATWAAGTSFADLHVDRRAVRTLFAVGTVLWITPAVLVASTARYQRELVLGLGHVPVYIEYFGFAMIALGSFLGAIEKWGKPGRLVRAALALGMALIGTTIYASNIVVIGISAPDKEGMQNMHAALQAGLMHDVPSGSELFVDGSIAPNRYLDQSAADAKFFYFLESGVRLDVHSIGTLPQEERCTRECMVGPSAYELINVPIGSFAGYDALGRIGSVAISQGEVRSFARQIVLFVRGIPSGQRLWVRYTEHGCGHDRSRSHPLIANVASITTRITSSCGSIEMNTLAVSETPES